MKSRELKAGREAARRELIKSEVMTFRIPSDDLENLYSLAEKLNVRVTVMVRDWVLERLTRETGETGQNIVIPNWEIQEIKNRLAAVEQKLVHEMQPLVREPSTTYALNQPKKSTKKRAKSK